ncbi:MAG TPA: glycosyltransferase family 1 protein [Pyrinomonadaceae bacterium]|jgi:glycosyltransferase involved in cell wall biosynthesis
MRIGLDGFPLAMPRTGIGHYTFELARSLALLSPSDEFELISPSAFTPSLLAELRSSAPKNLHAVTPATTRYSKHWWAIGLPLYLRRARLDLFHGTNYEAPLWNRGRTVVTIHDLSLLLHADKHEQRLARRARRRLPLMARSSEMIITATESVKREICEHLRVHAERVAVTPYAPRRSFRPIPLERTVEARRRLGVEDTFILFVGTIEPRKNLLTLVRAFDEILRHTPLRPQLVIAGREGWMTDDLHSFIERAGIKDRLLLTGYVREEDLAALYSSCRVCVYPSLYEGFGLPPLEAMACGAPVITSNIQTIVETVAEAARLVAPTDAQALAAAIVELLSDEAEARRLSSAGLQRAAQFSWERTARQTLDVYREVLARRKRMTI